MKTDIQKRIEGIADYLGCNKAELVSEVTKLIKDYGESLIGKDEEYSEHDNEENETETRNDLRQEMRAKLNGDIK